VATIRREQLVQSVADALQFISYYHPLDYVRALGRAYERRQSRGGEGSIAQILTNSRHEREGHRPMCQDTGIVNVFLKVGMNVRLEGFDGSLEDAVNEVCAARYLDPENRLRASVLEDPRSAAGTRRTIRRRHPRAARSGDSHRSRCRGEGRRFEAKSKFAMLIPRTRSSNG
jgi:fumarate hydratase class I